MNAKNMRELINQAYQNRQVKTLCRKVLRSSYLRLFKLFTHNNIRCEYNGDNKVKMSNGTYKNVELVSSKDFRALLKGDQMITQSRWISDIDIDTSKEYLNQIKRLKNTKHKNTLHRIWNGDCLSYSRLFHYGLVETNECPNCSEYDDPEHMLILCPKSTRIWELVKRKLPMCMDCPIKNYIIGINDSKMALMLKAEIIKYVMHFRYLEVTQIVRKSFTYIEEVTKHTF
jgi:hypothetical protein